MALDSAHARLQFDIIEWLEEIIADPGHKGLCQQINIARLGEDEYWHIAIKRIEPHLRAGFNGICISQIRIDQEGGKQRFKCGWRNL